MLDSDFVSTGSISQDALRLGFQPTCNKGIAKLLKVDDTTLEECKNFMGRHTEQVQEYLKSASDTIIDNRNDGYKTDIVLNYKQIRWYISAPKWIMWLWIKLNYNNQTPRKCTVKFDGISGPEISLVSGRIRSIAQFTIIEHSWKGYTNMGYKVYNESYEKYNVNIDTDAKVCKVKYIPYDNYHDRYIPDDAAMAAKQALDIGMERIHVAIPIIENTPSSDPIIVGYIGEQMFIIAWFGYDKNNHMSCNM